MKRMLVLIGLTLAIACTSRAQSQTFNLGSNITCNVQASSYLLCSDMGEVTLDGTPYVVASMFLIENIYSYPNSAPLDQANVGFDNATPQGGTNYNSAASGTYENHQVSVSFTGHFSGTMTFLLESTVGYRGYRHFTANNVVLTITSGAARIHFGTCTVRGCTRYPISAKYLCGKERKPCFA